MDKVFVFGATGGIGRLTVQRLLTKHRAVVALVRLPGQAETLAASGAEPVVGDLTRLSATELAQIMQGCGIAVFAAGASEQGQEVAAAVDGDGVAKALAACQAAGVRRYLHVSAFPDAQRGRGMSADFEHYMAVKRAADVAIGESELDWVIVRPGTLTNEPGGRVRLGQAIPYGPVSRASVTEVLVALVDSPLRGVVLELTAGSMQVDAALSAFERSISI